MKETIFTLLVSVVCLTFWMWQVDDNLTGLANERLKNAVNYAAHDASIQVNSEELANGRIVFDTAKAKEVFNRTLADNLSLDNNLVPRPNTLFKEKINVIYTDYIDDRDGLTFPYLYENDYYGIRHWVFGPAVVFAVEVPRPRAFNLNPSYSLVKWSVFEYPVPRS